MTLSVLQTMRPAQPAKPGAEAPCPMYGHSVEWSPYSAERLAIATCQYYGFVGNGRLLVCAQPGAAVGTPIAELAGFDTEEGMYDCAWSECAEAQIATVTADGGVQLWDLRASSRDGYPVRVWREHRVMR